MKAASLHGDPYWKRNGSKWWQGYDAHEDVIIDDFRGEWWPLTWMLALLDSTECRVECKGGSRQFKPRRVYITSIEHPEYAYGQTGREPVQQLLRRITNIIDLGAVPEDLVPEVGGVILDPPTLSQAGRHVSLWGAHQVEWPVAMPYTPVTELSQTIIEEDSDPIEE